MAIIAPAAHNDGQAPLAWDDLAEDRGAPAAPAAGGGDGLRIYRFDEWAELPDPPDLIGGLASPGEVIVLSGPSGTGKTFLALDLVARLATGDDSTGLPVKGRTPGLYLAAEATAGMRARIRMLPGESQARAWVIPGAPRISDPHYAGQVAAHIAANGIGVVVVDTMQKLAPADADESSSAWMADMTDAMKLITDAAAGAAAAGDYQITWLLVHHDNKAGSGPRGTSAIEADCDQLWRLSRVSETGIKLVVKKTKDREPTTWAIDTRRVETGSVDGNGDPRTTLVASSWVKAAAAGPRPDNAGTEDDGPPEWRPTKTELMELVDLKLGEGLFGHLAAEAELARAAGRKPRSATACLQDWWMADKGEKLVVGSGWNRAVDLRVAKRQPDAAGRPAGLREAG